MSMDTTMYNTVPAAADDEPLVQTKAAPTSIKKLIFAVAATVFVLGAVFATFVAPKSTIAHRVLTEENLDVINGTSYKSYFDFDLHPCNLWGCSGPFQGRALP